MVNVMPGCVLWKIDKGSEHAQENFELWTTSTVQSDDFVPRVFSGYEILDLGAQV